MRRFYLDCEFIESGRHNPIQLISIGIVSESGDEFYAISSEFNPHHASPWVRENVIRKLEPPDIVPRLTPDEIASKIQWFIKHRATKAEFWGYYSAYDFVVLCQLYGRLIDLPDNISRYCRDIKQLCDDLGNPQLPKKPAREHNALADAIWNREAYLFLKATKEDCA